MRLAHRVYRGATHLAEQEAWDAFIKALPAGLRCPIAAANPRMLNECVDNVTQMRAVLGDGDVDQYGQVSVQAVRVEDTVCYGCGKKGHYRRDCPDSASGGRTNAHGINKRRPMVCYNCDEAGHVIANCKYGRRATDTQGKRVGPLILKAASAVSGTDSSGNGNGSSR